MPGHIELCFQRLHYRSAEDSLVAVYEVSDFTTGLSKSVLRSFRKKDVEAFWETAAELPGVHISMSLSLDNSIEVVLSPTNKSLAEETLHLELKSGSATIRAHCDGDTYEHFKAVTQVRSIAAGDFRHNLLVSLGRASRLKNEFGFSIPIKSIRIRFEPTSSKSAEWALMSDVDGIPVALFGQVVSPQGTTGHESRDRKKRLRENLDEL